MDPDPRPSPPHPPSPPSAPRRETVGVVIPTYNVEGIIERCLAGVAGWADEIVVVDMESDDRTVEICRRYPRARIFQRKDYIFGNVNFGMEQASTDWVIRLDADEVYDLRLQRSIQEALAHPRPEIACYAFPSVQHMFGRPMRWGPGLPSKNIRKCMFRRGTARYEVRSEHEDITVTGRVAVLEGSYEHFTNPTVSEVIRKFDYYTEKDVGRLDPAALAPPRPWRILWRAARRFILLYLQWRGYRDGPLGFFSSLFRGPIYIFVEEAKRWEAWERARGRRP